MVSFVELFAQPMVLLSTLIFILLMMLFPFYKWIVNTIKYHKLTNRIPEPARPSWLGHDSYFTGDMKQLKIFRSLREVGKTVRVILGFSPAVFAVHPESAKVILSNDDPKDLPVWNFIKPLLGEGLLTSTGDKWLRNRKLLTHAFHFNTLRAYVPLIHKCFTNHMDLWEERCRQSDGSIDVTDGMKSATLNCLIATAFGDSSLTQNEKKTFREAAETVTILWMKRMGYLPHNFDFIYNLSANGRKFHKNIAILRQMNKQILEQSKASLKIEKNKGYKTFVELLIQAKDEEGNGLTDQEILDEINTFMLAGFDTTGSAIPYCIYYMAKHPDCQEKCRQEMNALFREKEEITWNDLQKLSYMTICIKETLRLAGPSLFTMRKLGTDHNLPDGLYVPRGTNAGVMAEAIHYNEECWDNPEEFRPERFSPENADKRHPYAYVAFSAGPRNCIGQNFAMLEMKMFLVLALKRFQLAVDERKPLVMSAPLLRGAEGGIWIRLTHAPDM